MNDLTVLDERDEDEAEAQVPGVTMALTDHGWEACDYVDPEDDWSVLGDGSCLSPDGRIRSWPLAGPEAG